MGGQQDALPVQPAPDGDRAGTPWVFAVAGATAAAVPAGPGLALAASGHAQAAVPLLICSGVLGMASVIAGAVVRAYETMQRTRRMEIQHAGPTAIAEAMARCIDDAHAVAQDVPGRQRAAEAASVRASAGQAVTEMMPAMLAALGQQTTRSDGLNDSAPGQA
jgi:hypothetical protein